MKQVFTELGPWLHAGLSVQAGRMVDGTVGVKLVRSWGGGGVAEGGQVAEGTSLPFFPLPPVSHSQLRWAS